MGMKTSLIIVAIGMLAFGGTGCTYDRTSRTADQDRQDRQGQMDRTTTDRTGASTTRNAQSIEGEVLSVLGDTYVVRDVSGRQVRIHVGRDTEVDGNIVAGDRVVARTAQGTMSGVPQEGETLHAVSLKKR